MAREYGSRFNVKPATAGAYAGLGILESCPAPMAPPWQDTRGAANVLVERAGLLQADFNPTVWVTKDTLAFITKAFRAAAVDGYGALGEDLGVQWSTETRNVTDSACIIQHLTVSQQQGGLVQAAFQFMGRKPIAAAAPVAQVALGSEVPYGPEDVVVTVEATDYVCVAHEWSVTHAMERVRAANTPGAGEERFYSHFRPTGESTYSLRLELEEPIAALPGVDPPASDLDVVIVYNNGVMAASGTLTLAGLRLKNWPGDLDSGSRGYRTFSYEFLWTWKDIAGGACWAVV